MAEEDLNAPETAPEADLPPQAEDPAAARIETLEKEVQDLKDKVLRTAAEMENTRKRAQRDVEETSKYAIAGFARDLVNVSENLQRALDSIPKEEWGNDPLLKRLGEGVELTLKELLSTFEKNGVRRINPLGEKFDHNYHQAVAQIETPDADAGTVVQVLQAGYALHDRLLRPAMVGVAKQGEVKKQVDTTA